MLVNSLLQPLTTIAERAGQAILEIYASDFTATEKTDHSPLTEADLAAHRIIVAALHELTPDMPVLSEESATVPYAVRRSWERYWLVDPLDGTKEFIKKNGEFTVNIALIERGEPVIGVVHVPVTATSYLGCSGVGAFRQNAQGRAPIRVQLPPASPPRVVASRSHRGPEVDAFLEKLGPHEIVSVGSSLKFCLLAEGRADLYPRLGPTCEWDTAAGHAVAMAAGATVLNINGAPLHYNQKDTLLNPYFLVFSDAGFDWRRCLT